MARKPKKRNAVREQHAALDAMAERLGLVTDTQLRKSAKRKRGGRLLVPPVAAMALALLPVSAAANIGPLEPIPAGLEKAVAAVDAGLPRSAGDTRGYVSDLLHLTKRGEQSALQRLKGLENGVRCFWIDALLAFAEGVASSAMPGAPIHMVVADLHLMHVRDCRGPGGRAAEEAHGRITKSFLNTLNDLRVSAAVDRVLGGRPLTPLTLKTLPAGPPGPGSVRALGEAGLMFVMLLVGLAIPAPEEAITWPVVYKLMSGS